MPKAGGWLIFPSHDGASDPIPLGCTPAFFEDVSCLLSVLRTSWAQASATYDFYPAEIKRHCERSERQSGNELEVRGRLRCCSGRSCPITTARVKRASGHVAERSSHAVFEALSGGDAISMPAKVRYVPTADVWADSGPGHSAPPARSDGAIERRWQSLARRHRIGVQTEPARNFASEKPNRTCDRIVVAPSHQ
jgi:hypothetical protein